MSEEPLRVPDQLPELGSDPFGGTFERLDYTVLNCTVPDKPPRCEPNGWVGVASDLSFDLDIEMSEEARIVKIGFTDPHVYVEDTRPREEKDADWRQNEDGSKTFIGKHLPYEKCFRKPTKEELDKTFTRRTLIITESREAGKYGFYRRNGGWRVRDALSVVLDHERRTRGESNWFGGVDLHHVAFSGLNFRKGKLQWNWDS